MSRMMKDLCQLYMIKQMRTHVYNHKTDGLCEWLNKTIKSIRRRVVDRRNWDMMLPHLIFALWEVPQAFTGFSPLELTMAMSHHP